MKYLKFRLINEEGSNYPKNNLEYQIYELDDEKQITSKRVCDLIIVINMIILVGLSISRPNFKWLSLLNIEFLLNTVSLLLLFLIGFLYLLYILSAIMHEIFHSILFFRKKRYICLKKKYLIWLYCFRFIYTDRIGKKRFLLSLISPVIISECIYLIIVLFAYFKGMNELFLLLMTMAIIVIAGANNDLIRFEQIIKEENIDYLTIVGKDLGVKFLN